MWKEEMEEKDGRSEKENQNGNNVFGKTLCSMVVTSFPAHL